MGWSVCGQSRIFTPFIRLGADLTLLIIIGTLLLKGYSASATATETDCTLYASPDVSTGSGNSGTTLDAPVSLRDAYDKTVPGSVVCLLDGAYEVFGTFHVQRSGEAGNWIVYKPYNPGTVLLRWMGSEPVSHIVNFRNGVHHVEVRGIVFDGNGIVDSALFCQSNRFGPYSHHLRFVDNVIQNTGATGIGTKRCDYIEVIGNKIYRAGTEGGSGWSSGISLNAHLWLDQYQGFHSVVVGNFVAGSYDSSTNHTDGNGIIVDLSLGGTGSHPYTLIANNVVYQNGGRCILTLKNSNTWVINNTCYSNSLDGQLDGATGSVGEYANHSSADNWYINNIAYAWTKGYTYLEKDMYDGFVATSTYYKNIAYGGLGTRRLPGSATSDPNQIMVTNPLFVNSLSMDTTLDGQWASAVHPYLITNQFHLQPGSPAIDFGIDPRTVPGVTNELRAGIEQFLLTDVIGTSRPVGAGWDLGAYEYSPDLATPTPTPTDTSIPTATPTISSTPTDTPSPTAAPTETLVAIATPTHTPSSTPTAAPTNIPTATATNTPAPTATDSNVPGEVAPQEPRQLLPFVIVRSS